MSVDGASEPTLSCLPRPKRSLFSKPSWSKKASSTDTESNIFRRSDLACPDFTINRTRQESQRAVDPAVADSGSDTDQRITKRARADSGEREAIANDTVAQIDKASVDDELTGDNSSYLRVIAISHQEAARVSIPQESEQNDDGHLHRDCIEVGTPAKTVTANEECGAPRPDDAVDVCDNEEVEDRLDGKSGFQDNEEIVELAQKARANAIARIAEESNPTHVNASDIKNGSSLILENLALLPHQDRQNLDPVIEILITSEIPNTRPLIVARRVSQNLKDVRITWLERQNLPAGFDDVFLTWHGKRLFDVTSCRSLGLQIHCDGEIQPRSPDLDFDGSRIHMEAMTMTMMKDMKQRKLHGQLQTAEHPIVESTPIDTHAVSQQLRIILKSREFSDFKIMVKPSTSVNKIVNAFRASNEIDSLREIKLQLDGETLHGIVGDTDIADLDFIDVHIK